MTSYYKMISIQMETHNGIFSDVQIHLKDKKLGSIS